MEYHLFQVTGGDGSRKFLVVKDQGDGLADFAEARKLVKCLKTEYSVPLDARTLKLCSCCVPAINASHPATFIDPTSLDEDPAFGFNMDDE